ncbi:MAG: 2-amino-4-hydroxy-6-hydroxymethyldihydropteridine diphosphokinase [Propionibacteriaceae bacterium]|nr:2-amino-4-hydroxy-6-hydroxymethyldihydropteridine diphosphokinase [Propionibacteriaceae bacterium]
MIRPEPDFPDRIVLSGLQTWGCHGVFEAEKTTPQLFLIDIRADLEPALSAGGGESVAAGGGDRLGPARPDDLAATVDYGQISRLATELAASRSYDLIETLADRLAAAILALGGLAAVEVTVHKPQAPLPEPFADVAVVVRRRRGRPRRRVVISAGSNLGGRLAWLQFGVAALATTPGVAVTAVSGVYESAPVGVGQRQPDYLNLVLIAESDLPAGVLLDRCLAVESAAGRRRDPSLPGPASRTLDLDLVAVDGERSASGRLCLPHPRAGQRAFVLVPWLEADPDGQLDGRPLAAWLADLPSQPLRRRDDLAVEVALPPSDEAAPAASGERPALFIGPPRSAPSDEAAPAAFGEAGRRA